MTVIATISCNENTLNNRRKNKGYQASLICGTIKGNHAHSQVNSSLHLARALSIYSTNTDTTN